MFEGVEREVNSVCFLIFPIFAAKNWSNIGRIIRYILAKTGRHNPLNMNVNKLHFALTLD